MGKASLLLGEGHEKYISNHMETPGLARVVAIGRKEVKESEVTPLRPFLSLPLTKRSL